MDKDPFKPDDMWKGASPRVFSNARKLRDNATEAEDILWSALRNKQLNGYKFRRQHPLSFYIADFYCHEFKLVVEVDGGYHQTKKQILLDNRRTADIEFQGLKVIRFTNEEVTIDLPNVLDRIKECITTMI
jgi:very-short-patch-repair endonuclease